MEQPVPLTLSRAALNYAAEVRAAAPEELGERLYSYHRDPMSPWLRRSGEFSASFGAGIPGELALPLFDHGWQPVSWGQHIWQSWKQERRYAKGSITYKLYVSPILEDVHEALHRTLALVPQTSAFGVKFPARIEAVVRPERILLYFDSSHHMNEAAEALSTALTDLCPHGVPFTCPHGTSGMLSWGVDPPATAASSWRRWLTQELGIALSSSGAAHGSERVKSALHHVASLGVDATNWHPVIPVWEPILAGTVRNGLR